MITRREAWIPPCLTLVSCGAYYFYWQYTTTEELKNATGRQDLSPAVDLLLTVVCCGLWGVYVQYRNMQVVHQTLIAMGRRHEDRSAFVLLMHALALLNYLTGFVALMLVQEDLNKLADAQAGRPY